MSNIIEEETIPKIFDECQRSSSKHKYYSRLLAKYYTQSPEIFLDGFSDCMYRVIAYPGKDKDIYTILKFIVLAVSQTIECSDPSIPQLYSLVLEDLASYSGAKNKDIRIRCCKLIAEILSMNVTIENDIWERLRYSMKSRLYDKIMGVRLQAVYAMSYLQDPNNDNDMIIKEMLKCAQTDSSKDVRRTATSNVVINSNTIPSLMNRVRDESEDVRSSLYLNITNHSIIRQFSIKQRRFLLVSGLKDRSEKVQESCKKMVIFNWLKNDDILTLLTLLDCESEEESGLLLLSTLFEEALKAGVDETIKLYATLKPNLQQLTYYESLYLRSKIHFLNTHNKEQEIEEYIEDIPQFIDLFNHYPSCVKIQLIHILNDLDIKDETCRTTLIRYLHQSIEKQCSEEELALFMVLYKQYVLPESLFIRDITELISSLKDELSEVLDDAHKLDSQIYILKVIKTLCKNCSPKFFYTPELLGLLNNDIVTCVTSEETLLRMESIYSLALFCIMNKTIGLQYSSLIMCISLQDDESPMVQNVALQALTDLVLMHNTLLQEGEEGIEIEEVVQALLTFLDSTETSLRTTAVHCFTKLFMCKRIENDKILSRLLLLLFNPTCSEDTFLIQLLSSFFPNYVNNNKDIYIHLIHASEMAIKTIVESPTDSPLYSINVTTFGKYIIYLLTCFNLNVLEAEPEETTSQEETKPAPENPYIYNLIDLFRSTFASIKDQRSDHYKELVKFITSPNITLFSKPQLELYNTFLVDIYQGIELNANRKFIAQKNATLIEYDSSLEHI